MKKLLKSLKYVLATFAILHFLANIIVLMAPVDIVKIAEYRIYPPCIGTYVDRAHDAECVYEKHPEDVKAKAVAEFARENVSKAVFGNLLVMGLLFLVAFNITSSYADRN